ncbi:hypothetical protein BDN67DRAFT_1017563 [Paxillus ammoniavirescens]|nr:hypothetical protein BDN67DRAFT_1017563 [Paxillus ammoniavirescens]
MDVPSIKKVRFAEDDPMQTESSSAESTNGADEATSSSGDDVDMTSPVASPPSSTARPTAVMLLQPGSPSAPFLRWPTDALGPMPPRLEVPRRQTAVAHPPAVLVMELNQLSIEPMSTTAEVPSPRPIRSLPQRAHALPLAESPMVPTATTAPTAPSTQPGPSTQFPSIPPTPLRPSRSMGVIIPPVPGAKQGPLNFARPMARDDIRGRRDEVMEALDFPGKSAREHLRTIADGSSKMQFKTWPGSCGAMEFRCAMCHAASAGNMSSVDLDFGRHGERGPVAPIDPHHDAPLVEAFTKYYNQWVQLHLRRRRELLAELMLLRQMEGLDDLIKHTEGLDTEWMRDQ